MKKIIPAIAVLLYVVVLLFSFRPAKKVLQKESPAGVGNGMAVVELFTSEGCSSCPPADELMAKAAKAYKNKVFVLGFHVDYWNRLGWKDVFSTAAYTARQQRYAAVFGLNAIYTPQVIVNGKTEFTGSNESRLRKTIEAATPDEYSKTIAVTAKSNAATVEVNYSVKEPGDDLLNIALVQLQASSAVKSGENEGRHLLHINVVRDFVTHSLNKGGKGNASLHLPAGLLAKDFVVIAYAQNSNNFHVTGATEVMIP